jgi:hypothetical protein
MRRTEQSLRASRSTKDFDMREMAQIVVTDRPTAEPNWTHFAKSDLPETNADHLSLCFARCFVDGFPSAFLETVSFQQASMRRRPAQK